VTTPATFDAIDPGQLRHDDEIKAGYRPSPTLAEQDRTHGAGLPAEDCGMSDEAKYGGGGRHDRG
jgi:hypothetical protein